MSPAPSVQQILSKSIGQAGHPFHNTVNGIMRCQAGCARRVAEHLSAIETKDRAGLLPPVPPAHRAR